MSSVLRSLVKATLLPPRAPQSLLTCHARSSLPRPGPDAPYVLKMLSRTRSTCYIRITNGCKRPEARTGSAIPTRPPFGWSSRTSLGTDSGPESRILKPESRLRSAGSDRVPEPRGAHRRRSAQPPARAATSRRAGRRPLEARPGSCSTVARSFASAMVKSPLRVRRSRSRCARFRVPGRDHRRAIRM